MTFNRPDSGYLGKTPENPIKHKFIVEGDRVHEIHNVLVHRFSLGDVEDPELYAAQPIYEWQQSEQGKWVMEHSVEEPVWHRYLAHTSCSYEYGITAKLKGADYTFFTLKWGQNI